MRPPDRVRRRVLIHIPIIHTQADMGALAGSVRRVTVQKLGRQAWKSHVEAIGQMWEEIRRAVEGWGLPWENVRLYQDGLPRCGREAEIVAELASAGSANHQLLLSLMKRGATLMGTESPELLLEEYRLVQEVLAAKDPKEAARIEARHGARSRSLLARRDEYIARRVNESLRPGETGLLFLGMLHSLDARLATDIRVTHPIRRPPHPRRRAT
ncbi:MAG: hypothetical protein HYV93_03345 [Candidatus Rokubacteria bacterium]|nr:hypothetical protein [Candidatus Rokubacteria bacterium]